MHKQGLASFGYWASKCVLMAKVKDCGFKAVSVSLQR